MQRKTIIFIVIAAAALIEWSPKLAFFYYQGKVLQWLIPALK
jgi:hypothetical protein